MGKEIAKISAARGFAAELSTAIVIMIAAQYGLPTSSSQCITGGIVGIGIVEGVQKGVNWKQFGLQFMSWVLTIFVMALGTAAFFKQGTTTTLSLSHLSSPLPPPPPNFTMYVRN